MNERDYYFSIYEYEKKSSSQRTNEHALHWIVSMKYTPSLEYIYNDLYQNVTQYAQDLRILNLTYQHLKMN